MWPFCGFAGELFNNNEHKSEVQHYSLTLSSRQYSVAYTVRIETIHHVVNVNVHFFKGKAPSISLQIMTVHSVRRSTLMLLMLAPQKYNFHNYPAKFQKIFSTTVLFKHLFFIQYHK